VTRLTEQPDADATGDPALEQRSRELFNAQVDGLDAHTRSRLNRARQAALAAASGSSSSVSLGARWLLPVGSAAALALVTVSAVQLMRAEHETVPVSASLAASNTADDMEILASNEELDMLQNVDFYAWLDTQTDSLDAASSGSETG
jgi:hypothetical protein